VSLVLGTLLAGLMVAAVASGDNLITQDLVTDGNATAARLGSGNAEVYVAQTGPACDANGDRIDVTSNQSWLTIASPGYVNVTGCGTSNAQTIGYSLTAAAPLGGVARVTGSENVDDSQISTGPNSDFDVTVVPRAPSNLTSPSTTTTYINLSWTLSPDDSDLTNYQLEAATSSGGPWTVLSNPAKGSTTYTHSGLAPSTQRCYQLAARYQAGGVGTLLSSFAGPLCVTTNSANTPPSVYVTGVSNGASYEAGSVPAAGCSVTDTEDGTSTFAASLSSITGPLAAYGLGSRTATCTYTDGGGLSGTASATYSIADTTNPGISFVSRTPAANANGWNKATVTVEWSCTDGGSGVVSASVTSAVSTEGASQSATGTCTDHAGNTASNTQTGINIDKTAPTASASASPAANTNGWNNTNVTVSFSGSDGLSGIDFCTADAVLSSEGSGQSASGTCTDKAGNVSASATASGINIDKTAPTITQYDYSPAANGAGWHKSNITVRFKASDGLSGLNAACETAFPDVSGERIQSKQITTEGNPVTVDSDGCTDLAGNAAGAKTSSEFKLDKTAPSVALVGGPTEGGSYYFGFVPAAPTCSASDLLSGLAGTCSVTGYSGLVGPHTVTASATDRAGNTSSDANSYTVLAWALKGFYQPVDMNDVYNVVKNGSTVPLKFEIFAGPTELTDVAAVKSLTYAETACNATATTDDIETLATGGTVLRYDSTGGQFIYNWKTPSTAGKCYRVTMVTLDGSSLAAFFRLK
jgi:hypothetical protein